MWDHLPLRSFLDLQRHAAVQAMGEQARKLLQEGYAVDADRVLDQLNERRQAWIRNPGP